MVGGRPVRVFTVPPGAPFLDRLATFLLDEVAGAGSGAPDLAALAAATVYLPTRRAARALGHALHRAAGGAVLLPRIRGLGEGADGDDPARFGLGGGDEDFSSGEVVSETERRVVLADIARQWARTTPLWDDRTPEIGPHPVPANPGEAVALASELAGLLDEMAVAGTGRRRLETLVPDDLAHLARNWRINLEFLTHVADRWSDHLARRGLTERVARRDLSLIAEAERLRRDGSPTPVVAAGSTGSVPAAATLMEAIAGLANGAVVLPGLDTGLDEEGWRAIGPDHPQFGMKRLIEAFGVSRERVVELGDPGPPALAARRRLASEVMRPAETTDRWMEEIRSLDATELRAALATTSLIEASDEHEEARVVALMLRRAVETESGLTALVTPDRGLARRVAGELARWNMGVDDSGGRPLDRTPQGVFLRLVAETARAGFAPLPTLALLKHPLARLCMASGETRHAVRVVELAALRGGRPAAGIGEIVGALDRAASSPRRHPVMARLGPRDFAAARDLLVRFEAAFAPLAGLFGSAGEAPARALLVAHIEAAEAVARVPAGEAAELWSGEAGEALALFLAEAVDAAGEAAALLPADFASWLAGLMRGRVVRERRSDAGRVVIWGPLEARLQAVDRAIFSGLNEGTWPAETRTDPWFGRPMRAALGLEPPERRIGLQAHDVVEGLMAKEVVLTRSEKAGGAPAVPSRWLWRLRALLDGLAVGDALEPAEPWLAWVRGLDESGPPQPCLPPRPAPPLAARPKRLSVTRIETWIRDPYAIYAREVLRLEPLEAIDAPPDAADYGQIIHSALARLIAAWPHGPLPGDALDRLIACGRDAFAELDHRPGLRAYWWLRFERIARWFVDLERRSRDPRTRSHTEVSGSVELLVAGRDEPFRLTARADRIDVEGPGGARIVDYKTGRGPGDREIAAMLAPQLPLEAAILERGGFDGIAGVEVAGLAHVSLTGRQPAGEVRTVPGDPHALAEDALARLARLVAAYADPDRPYLSRIAPQREAFVGDYDHLARVGEWSLGLGRRHGG